MLLYLTQGLLLGATASAQPGPLQAYLLSQVLKNGWKHTLPAAFAPLLSDGPILILILFILTRTPAWLLTALQISGGFFLLYLAYGAYKAFKETHTSETSGQDSMQENLLKAVLINALSPNPYIFWATIAGPILIEGWRQAPTTGLSFIIGFYTALIGGFIAFIALFAITKRLDPRVSRWLNALSGLVLALFGIYQLWQGLSQLLQ